MSPNSRFALVFVLAPAVAGPIAAGSGAIVIQPPVVAAAKELNRDKTGTSTASQNGDGAEVVVQQ